MSILWASTTQAVSGIKACMFHCIALKLSWGKIILRPLEKYFINFCIGYDSADWPYYVLQQLTLLSISS